MHKPLDDRGVVGGAEDVLEAQGNAGQRSQNCAGRAPLVSYSYTDESIDLAVDCADLVERGLD